MERQEKSSEKNIYQPERSPLDIRGEPAKKVAILFTDMKGSSAFYKTRGNQAGRIVIQKLNDMLFPIIRAYNGIIVKTIGDSIMAYFLLPKEALWSSIAMQKRLQKYNKDHSPNEHLLVRIAINYGYGIVEERDVFGDVVNVAGKLISCCDAQQIIVSELFYRETESTPDVSFSPYHVKEKKEQIENINIYKVEWEKTREIEDIHNIYLFSLRMEKSSREEGPSEDIEKILPLIKEDASKLISIEESEVNATFPSSKACLETARKTIQNYLHFSAEGNELPHILKVGLHIIGDEELEEGKSLELFFDEPISARDSAEPYEIVITSRFYSNLTTDLQKACREKKESPDIKNPFYTFHLEESKEHPPVFVSLIPDEAAEPGSTPCFYCGNTRHPTGRCPSKLIQNSTKYLEKLAYTPLHQIRQIFDEHFTGIVRPLKSGKDEERFEVLFNEDKDDPYSLGFFSFYELTEVFQLRSLHELYLGDMPKKVQSPNKAGALMIGKDCIRVSRFDEAGEWFDKAVKENPNDYRPFVALGILSMERSDPEKALFHFRKALCFSLRDIQKCHILLLCARLYETSGALPNAKQETENVLRIFPKWQEARYYYAVILAKTGRVSSAIDIFKQLLDQSPHYYIVISIDPELNAIKKDVSAFLNRELIRIRSRSLESFTRIKETIEEYEKWFSKDDEDYKKAFELFRKASGILQEESISGLIDIPDFEIYVRILFKQTIERRRKKLQKKIFLFKKTLERNSSYLDRFPYKRVLSPKDFKLNKDFESLLENAKKAVGRKTPWSFQDIQPLIENLSKKSGKLKSNLNRLEIIKNILFALECLLKIFRFFFITGATTGFIVTLFLILFRGVESSLQSITITEFIIFLKYGFFAGLLSGVIGTAVWIKKRFPKMYKKIEI